MTEHRNIPEWLSSQEHYRPGKDRDGFVTRSMLSLTSALSQLRETETQRSRISPTAPVKLVVCLGCVLMVSLARNYLFVLTVLAGLLVRACLLPRRSLSRVVAGSVGAAALTMVVMAPSLLLGQPRSMLTLATKSLVSVSAVLTVTCTTPAAELTLALRTIGVPATVILTVELALNGIVRLGETALEVLCALRLRSVGTNRHKQASMGGIGGVVLLKASRAAQDTYDAMRCRGFDGTYRGSGERPRLGPADAAWLVALVLLVAAFLIMQGVI